MRRWIAPAVGLAAAVLAAAWALAGGGGTPAACVPACDCEAVGTGLLAQPANALTSLAIAGAGLVLLAVVRRADLLPAGFGVAAAGAAAFAAHSTVSAAAYRSEGAALAFLAWSVALRRWPRAAIVVAAGAAAAAWALDSPGSLAVAGAGALAALAAARRARARPAIAGTALLAGGLVLRALADDGGPWCRPGAPLPGHAAWHLLAAAGLVLLILALDTDSPGRHLPSGAG